MAVAPAATALNLHASCVAWRDRALLITGASGSGKSSLSLELMAYGCALVADDRTLLTDARNGLVASAPQMLQGRIEARYIGILAASSAPPTPVKLVIDLDRTCEDRLPPERSVSWLGHELPLILRPARGHVAAAVLQYLKAGRSA